MGLRNPNSKLEVLDLENDPINNHVIIPFADALSNNWRLQKLVITSEMSNITPDGFLSFTYTLLCNNSSILSTYLSNHSLEMLSHTSNEDPTPEDLISLLRINRENSNIQTAHIKIIKIHFSGSDINTQIIAHMDVNVLPTVIAWMSRDEGSDGNGDLLFAFLRSMPMLCEMKSKIKRGKGRLSFVEWLRFAFLWTWPWTSAVNVHHCLSELLWSALLLEILFHIWSQSQW